MHKKTKLNIIKLFRCKTHNNNFFAIILHLNMKYKFNVLVQIKKYFKMFLLGTTELIYLYRLKRVTNNSCRNKDNL